MKLSEGEASRGSSGGGAPVKASSTGAASSISGEAAGDNGTGTGAGASIGGSDGAGPGASPGTETAAAAGTQPDTPPADEAGPSGAGALTNAGYICTCCSCPKAASPKPASPKPERIYERIFTDANSGTRWYNLYQLAIIISGLFTTATFPGMVSAYIEDIPQSIITQQNHCLLEWFRAACVMSFCSSLLCIISSFFVIVVPFLADTEEWESQSQLVSLLGKRVEVTSYLALFGLMSEIWWGLVAALLSAFAFMNRIAGWISFCGVAFLLVVILDRTWVYWDLIRRIRNKSGLARWVC